MDRPWPPRPDEPETHGSGGGGGGPLPAAAALVVGALAVGLAVDTALSGPPGIGITIAIVTAALVVVGVCRPRRAALPFLVAAVLLAACVPLRASGVVVAIDVATAAAMLALGVAFARAGRPIETTLRAYVARTASPAVEIAPAAAALSHAVTSPIRGRGTHFRSLSRALVLGVPVLGALAVLLASADPVFAHYLERPFAVAPDSLPRHLGSFALGALLSAALLVRGMRPVDVAVADRRIETPWSSGATWTALVGAVAALMTAFMLVQLSVAFAGEGQVQRTSGLTYAEYARSGFWQLLAAAIIAASVIVAAWCAGARTRQTRKRTVFIVAALMLIAGVLIVLASAFRRLSLYEQAFGFTWPRLLGHTAVIVLGVLLACGVAAVVTARARWLPTAVVAVATMTAIGLTTLDPEAFIAERNLARLQATGSLDASELEHLSADALPLVLTALEGATDPCERHALTLIAASIAGRMPTETGWSSWNLARSRAEEALAGEASPLPGGADGLATSCRL